MSNKRSISRVFITSNNNLGKIGLPIRKYPRPSSSVRNRPKLSPIKERSNESTSEKIRIKHRPSVTDKIIDKVNSTRRRRFKIGNPVKGIRNFSRRVYQYFSKSA